MNTAQQYKGNNAYDVPVNPNYIAALLNQKTANDNASPLEKLALHAPPVPESNVVYFQEYAQNRLRQNYDYTTAQYQSRRIDDLHDFTGRVPGKRVDIFPESVMGGIMGFTYLGDSYMALREDIRDDTSGEKLMVDVHESIHTPDEYETRILTDWILTKERQKYIK